MDYNKIKIGKIKTINKECGIGEIVSTDSNYLFTINDINEKINEGDLVRFRAELINEQNRAFFVKKINQHYTLNNNIIKSKKYISKKNRGE